MDENQQPRKDNEQSGKQKRTPLSLLAGVMIGLLVVLVLIYLQALLRPFKVLSSVLTPIIIGLVLAYLANPLLRLFEFRCFYRLKSRRVNRALSLFCSYLVILLMIAGVVWLIVPQVIDSINDLRVNGLVYIDNIIASVNNLIRAIPFLEENPDKLFSFEKLLEMTLEWLNGYSMSLVSGIGSVLGGIITVLKNILVGFFVSLYVLLSKDRLNAGCRRIFRAFLSPKKEEMLLYYLKKAHSKFGGFFIGKIIDSILIGLLSGVIFAIFKIPYSTLIAVIVGVTNVIPFFGPFIGAVPSAIIIFIKDPMKALVFALLILIIQQFDGNVLGPLILGGSTGLSSLGILVAITVASGLFGFTGMLLGVPLFALLMAVFDDYISTKLHKKGYSARLRDYYPADAFIKPDNPEEAPTTPRQRFVTWIISVETEEEGVDYTPSIRHSLGKGLRICIWRIGRFFRKLPPPQKNRKVPDKSVKITDDMSGVDEVLSILPQEPERPAELREDPPYPDPTDAYEASETGEMPMSEDASRPDEVFNPDLNEHPESHQN